MTTRDKLEFALEMGRRTRASVRQCEALMRYAGTLAHYHSQAESERISVEEYAKYNRIRRKVRELCSDLAERRYDVVRNHCTIASNLDLSDAQDLRDAWLEHNPNVDCQIMNMGVVPVFSGPVLKIRVPDGGEIEVPS